jgi:predicted MFS family arabinose efflux permease
MSGFAPGESGYGWRTPLLVLVAGCLIGFIPFGLRAGAGLFLAPLSQDLGWGREVFAFSVALQNIVWGLGVPLAGMLADKFGSGRVLFGGGILLAAGFALMSEISSPLHAHLAAGLLTGLGMAGTTFTIVFSVLARVVPPERRAATLGIATAATSFGQFVLIPVAQGLIDSWGWQSAALALGAIALLVLPLTFALTGKPSASTPGFDQPLAAALREAFGYRSYVLLVAGFFVCGFQLMFITTHLPAYFSDKGMASWVSGATLALIGLTNVAGSLAGGYFSARFPKKYGLSVIYFARAVALALFVLLPLTEASALVFGAVMGVFWLSTVPFTSGLVAHFFGLRWMASLFGLVFLSHQVGAFTGVWLGGLLFDSTGSYDLIWWITAALGVFAGLVHLPIREAPVPRLATGLARA